MNHDLLQGRLTQLPLRNIRAYLASSGWISSATIKDVASVWHREEPGNKESEILLPENSKLRDYWHRLLDVVTNLAEFERKTAERMLHELTLYFCDQVSIRVVHNDVEAGTIPLLDGVLLNERSRDLMVAAAVTTVAKRRNFSGHRPSEANEYISTLRLGQTAVGSYVVNIIAPVARAIEPQGDMMDSSFSRVVTTNLVQGLAALSSVLYTDDPSSAYSEWDAAVSKGASANMCEALIGLSGERRNREFTVSIELSNEIQYGSDLASKFTFSPDHVKILQDVAEYYRDRYVRIDFTVQGYVKKLDRDRGNENGIITVTADIGGVEKKIEFELSGDSYKDAIHAHENREAVSCRGDLHVTPRKTKLLNARDFKVLKNGRLFDR